MTFLKFKQAMVSIILLFPYYVYASENLLLEDYYGAWESAEPAVSGEKQLLTIETNKSVTFSRSFIDYPEQVFKIQDENLHWVNGIIILEFDENELGSGYTLVLSGWKTEKTKVIYGTLYMYRKGLQFNGIPVYFDAKEQSRVRNLITVKPDHNVRQSQTNK